MDFFCFDVDVDNFIILVIDDVWIVLEVDVDIFVVLDKVFWFGVELIDYWFVLFDEDNDVFKVDVLFIKFLLLGMWVCVLYVVDGCELFKFKVEILLKFFVEGWIVWGLVLKVFFLLGVLLKVYGIFVVIYILVVVFVVEFSILELLFVFLIFFCEYDVNMFFCVLLFLDDVVER